MKCGYGDSQHVQDDPEDYYTGAGATNLRRLIYRTYRDLNKIQGVGGIHHLTARDVPLDLHEWVFVNKQDYPAAMRGPASRPGGGRPRREAACPRRAPGGRSGEPPQVHAAHGQHLLLSNVGLGSGWG